MLTKYNFPTILGGLFLLFLPFVTSRHLFYGATNAKFFYVLFFTYLFYIVFAYKIYNNEIVLSLRKKYFLLTLIFFGLVSLVSSVAGLNSTMSFWSDILRSTGVIFLFHGILLAFVWSYLFKEMDWSFLRRSIIFAASVFSFLFSLGSQGVGLFTGRFLGINFQINGLSIGNETFAGAFLFFAVIFTLIELTKTEDKKIKKYLKLGLFFLLVNPMTLNFGLLRGDSFSWFAIIGVARASALVIFASCAYFLVYKVLKNLKPNLLKIFNSLALVFVVVVPTLLFIRGSVIQDKYIEISTAARILTWEAGLNSFENRPLLGYGPENFSIAFQDSFNSDLYLNENIGEVWFDKAHNPVVETLATKGILGLVSAVLVLVALFIVLFRAMRRGFISKEECTLSVVLIIGHLLQIFTSFDTVITQVILIFIFAYILFLENNLYAKNPISVSSKKTIGVFIFIITIASFALVFVPERVRQHALYSIFVTQDYEKRISFVEKLDTGKITVEPLRTPSTALVKGIFTSGGNLDQQMIQESLGELDVYDRMYSAYVAKHPYDYRARVDLVYVRFAQTFLGNNKLNEETRNLILEIYEISPANPLSYVLDSLFMVYTGKVGQAKTILVDAQKVFPEVEFISSVIEFVDVQEQKFPNISFLVLENI